MTEDEKRRGPKSREQVWAEGLREGLRPDLPAAIAEGLWLCDKLVACARTYLDGVRPTPGGPDGLLTIQAMLGTWTTGAWRAGHRVAEAGGPAAAGVDLAPLQAANERAEATIRELATRQAAMRAKLPPVRERRTMTNEEARDAIRRRRRELEEWGQGSAGRG